MYIPFSGFVFIFLSLYWMPWLKSVLHKLGCAVLVANMHIWCCPELPLTQLVDLDLDFSSWNLLYSLEWNHSSTTIILFHVISKCSVFKPFLLFCWNDITCMIEPLLYNVCNWLTDGHEFGSTFYGIILHWCFSLCFTSISNSVPFHSIILWY